MDINQLFGNDITLDATGNLFVAQGIDQTQQALIRRLLTNPGAYIWHPEYGAGVGRFVGENLSAQNFDAIKSTMVSQILEEETIAKVPIPQISFTPLPGNILQCDVLYYNAQTNIAQSISFQVS